MIERRSFDITDLTTRAKGEAADGSHLEGYASVFQSDSVDLGGFTERVAPGAFKRSLEAAAKGEINVFALWSHDTSQPLGSTGGGKLSLEEDDKGLRFRLDTARMTPAQLDAAKDGEVRMSFGFSVREQQWKENEDGSIERTLVDVDLFEVSPVISPAYPDTTAALRSRDAWLESRRTVTEDQIKTMVAEGMALATGAAAEMADAIRDQRATQEIRNRLLVKILDRRLRK